jgi:hypothetical protein
MVKDSCAVVVAMDREDTVFVDTCYKRPVDTDRFKEDLAGLTHGKRVQWTVFDPSNDSSLTIFREKNIFYEMTHGENRVRRGFTGKKHPGSIAAGVDTIKRKLKLNPISNRPSLYIMNRPENQELIKSFRTLQRESYVNEEIKGQKDKIQEGVHDHHAALRYIFQNKLRWAPVVEDVIDHKFTDEEVMVA